VTTEIAICTREDIEPDSAKRFDIEGFRLAVVRIECEIECPMHGSTFSLKTGEPHSLPATKPVPVFSVRLEGEDVVVTLP
jgi:3-phenylpropionate/trans-cinnamate dioxygenase ferredoxin component